MTVASPVQVFEWHSKQISDRRLTDVVISLFGDPSSMPVWADGGTDEAGISGGYSPREHRIAAFPSQVARCQAAELAPGELVSWLRKHTPALQSGITLVGLSYDAGRSLESIPEVAPPDVHMPDVVVATYPAYIEWCSGTGSPKLWATDASAADRLLAAANRPHSAPLGTLPNGLSSATTQQEYSEGLDEVLAGISRGDFYQTNIARRLEAQIQPELTPTLYLRMRALNPAAFGLLWALDDNRWIASSSPECLLTWDPETRMAHSYPIKGTRRRDANPSDDQRLAEELRCDPKERAEHVMIVDLVRNDLGRVAEVGSVHVPQLFQIQSLPTVHHLVSDVAATIRNDCDLPDILGAIFPGGSITGAPKIAAMKKIAEIEPVCRSFYTGSIGVIAPDGSATFNILIRTCLVSEDRLLYYTGGGVVADSTPEREWEETLEKAAAVQKALATT